MAKKVKFYLNRRAFQEQILYSEQVGQACAAVLGEGAEVSRSNNARKQGRIRARLYGDLADEAANGTLSRRLG